MNYVCNNYFLYIFCYYFVEGEAICFLNSWMFYYIELHFNNFLLLFFNVSFLWKLFYTQIHMNTHTQLPLFYPTSISSFFNIVFLIFEYKFYFSFWKFCFHAVSSLLSSFSFCIIPFALNFFFLLFWLLYWIRLFSPIHISPPLAVKFENNIGSILSMSFSVFQYELWSLGI